MYQFIRRIKKKIRSKRSAFVDPEEIFLDAKNLPEFDTQQFEGQFERPISRSSVSSLIVILSITMIFFGVRLWKLQITEGDVYRQRSENNSLDREPIFAPRGTIEDRNGTLLAWNVVDEDIPWGQRAYISTPGFSHVIGYVGYPARDKSGKFWQTEITGKDGIERSYNEALGGKNGSRIVERDISGKTQGGTIVNQPVPGEKIVLTIDAQLQGAMQRILSQSVRDLGYRSASAVMMDVNNGEVIVMTSVPEYDPNVMSSGDDVTKVRGYLTSSSTPLINRAISGLFTPGSIVKPYIALAALKEGVVTERTRICSCGSITIPNPYNPSMPAIFRDFNPDNGMVNVREALAVSSNIYFMEVTGGYRDQPGIGITKLEGVFKQFGLTEKTGIDLLGERSGIVPSPAWKAERFKGEIWRVGDTYNTSIGQYGVQVTPMEMARSLAAIANKGTLVTPRLRKSDEVLPVKKIEGYTAEQYAAVHEGMRMGVTDGTGRALSALPFEVATKTGTAQVGVGAKSINAWLNGFFPYSDPKYALVIVMDSGPQSAIGASQRVGRDFLEWVSLYAPQYTK